MKPKNKVSLKLSDIEKMDTPLDDDIELDLKEEQLKMVSPSVREVLVRDSIRRAIRRFGEEGISVDEISELTGFTRNTIQKHLKTLIGLREVYAQKKNRNLTLYYPNGKPLHHLGKVKFDWNNPIFEIYIAQGPKENLFFYILEKRYSILEGEVSEGAVMVPVEHLDEFVEELKNLRDRIGGMENAE